jgi:uncharacterized protein (TIGR03067 family)
MPTDLEKLQGSWTVIALESDGQKMPATMLGRSKIVIKGRRFKSVAMGETYEGIMELVERQVRLPPSRAKRASASLAEAFGKGGKPDTTADGSPDTTTDRATKLKAFDLVFTAGPQKGVRNLGIYRLNGDRWTICLATRGRTRPDVFATRPGTGLALETLARGNHLTRPGSTSSKADVASKQASRPAPRARSWDEALSRLGPVEGRRPKRGSLAPQAARAERSAAPSDVVTQLEGDWNMLSGVFSGAALDKNMIKWCRRVTTGNVTTVMAGPQVMLKAAFTLDRSRDPHAIDYVNIEGSNAGRPQAGIAEQIGDTLRICIAAPGKPRPADFSSRRGDGRSYTTWRRAKA